jgi:hypothetical protein
MTSRHQSERVVERRTVSRKTPRDGKLEVTKRAAAALESLGNAIPFVDGDRQGDARN